MAMEQRSKKLRADRGHPLLREPSAAPKSRKPHDRVLRFLGLIRLLAGGQEWGARQLSQQFDVTERTIMRDMKLLEDAGLIIRPGSRSRTGYRLARQAAWDRPQLSLEEVLAVITLTGQAAENDAYEGVILQGAALKLVSMQPDDVRVQLESLLAQLSGQESSSRSWLCRQAWLPLLVQALVHHLPLRVSLVQEYESEPAKPLVVVPTCIEARAGGWLMWGYEVSGSDTHIALEKVVSMERDVVPD